MLPIIFLGFKESIVCIRMQFSNFLLSLFTNPLYLIKATEHLQQYLLMLKQQHQFKTSSEDKEYQSSLQGFEEGLRRVLEMILT